MWCIAALTLEYRKRMYHLLALYARLQKKEEPVVCVDEKSLQVLAHSRAPMPMKSGSLRKEDYEYERRGTVNLFVAVEPKAGLRVVVVTERRGKADFVGFIQTLLCTTYKHVRRLHVVLDNLNTHFQKAFVDVLGKREAALVLRRVRFHYTPKHASWLNMAEIEIGVLIPFLNHPCTMSASLAVRLCCRRFAFAFTNDVEMESRVNVWLLNLRHAKIWSVT